MTRRRWLAACAALPAAAVPQAGGDRRGVILRQAELLASYPGQQIPASSNTTAADQIVSGTILFNGRTPVRIGLRDIDWSGGHMRHQEWPAQLNRFAWLRPLASAYQATRNERYAVAARGYIEDWMRGDPYPGASKRRPGDSALTMAIRLGDSEHPGWTGILPAFLASPAFDDAFLDRMLASIAGQADFALAHLTPGPNWYISQLDALVFLALRLPFLEKAPVFRATGVARLREEFARQFTPDGVHIERTPSYHRWMTSVAVTYYDLGRRLPAIDVGIDPRRTARSLDYAAQSELCGFNDTALAADAASEKYRSERRTLLPRLGLSDGVPDSPPLDQVFPDAGQVFSRTGWDRNASYLAFDAGKWGSNHSHLSRLAFTYRVNGRIVIADPGILSYEMSDPLGPYGKSTAAHSTVSVEGANQSPADAQLLYTAFTPETATMHARYQGSYWKGAYGWSFENGHGEGIWAEHERVLFWVKGAYLLVIDRVAADPGRTVHNSFQLGPRQVSLDAARLRLTLADVEMAVQMVAPVSDIEVDCVTGQQHPPRGFIGLPGQAPQASPHLRFRYRIPGPRPVTTVIAIAPAEYEVTSPETGVVLISRRNGQTERVTWSQDRPYPKRG